MVLRDDHRQFWTKYSCPYIRNISVSQLQGKCILATKLEIFTNPGVPKIFRSTHRHAGFCSHPVETSYDKLISFVVNYSIHLELTSQFAEHFFMECLPSWSYKEATSPVRALYKHNNIKGEQYVVILQHRLVNQEIKINTECVFYLFTNFVLFCFSAIIGRLYF